MIRHFALLVGATTLALATPGSALAQERAGGGDEPADEIAEELSDAVRTLEDVEGQIERAEREVEDAEQRLTEATRALAGLEREIAVAEVQKAAAKVASDDAAVRLEAVEDELARAVAAEADAVSRLQKRSVEVFKYGTGQAQRKLVTGIVGANDLHEVVFATRAVSRIIRSDRELVQDAEVARSTADEARRRAAAARREAQVAERVAIQEQRELTALVEAQQAAVADVEQERARREAVLDELREDSQVTELLVTRLAEEVARLEANAAAPPPPDPDPEPDPQPAEPMDEPAPPEPDPAPGDAPSWAAGLPAVGQPWAAAIDAAAGTHGLDGRLFAALVWTESGFDANAVSWAGAIGLAQLMPGTAAALGVDPWIPEQNLDGGARYLAAQYTRFGSIELALAAYNAGPNAVQAAGGIPNNVETPLYVVRVLERYNVLAG